MRETLEIGQEVYVIEPFALRLRKAKVLEITTRGDTQKKWYHFE
jgi:hypothetical protein